MKDDIVNESVWCFYVRHRGVDTVRCSKMKLCALSKKERHREVCLHVSSRKFTLERCVCTSAPGNSRDVSVTKSALSGVVNLCEEVSVGNMRYHTSNETHDLHWNCEDTIGDVVRYASPLTFTHGSLRTSY